MKNAPFKFLKYALPDEDVELYKKAGKEPVRMVHNNGSVVIQDKNGNPVINVLAVKERKRTTPHDAPDDERDQLAQEIVVALNSHDDLLENLRADLKLFEIAFDVLSMELDGGHGLLHNIQQRAILVRKEIEKADKYCG